MTVNCHISCEIFGYSNIWFCYCFLIFCGPCPFLYLIPYGIGFDENISGRWISANESVLSVNINSGKSDAVGEGTTQGKDK